MYYRLATSDFRLPLFVSNRSDLGDNSLKRMTTGWWGLTAVLGMLWLAIALQNAVSKSAPVIRRLGREPSSIPFIGGVFAILAAYACPWASPLKWGLLFLALLLDFGSLPYVAMIMIWLAFPSRLKAINKRREERVRRILGPAQAARRESADRGRE